MSVACPHASAVEASAASGFVPVDDNARWALGGEVTTATVARMLDDAEAVPLPSSGVVDCDGVQVVDSAAVALLLALKRRAKAEQREITFANVPAPLVALASVYGVADLIVS